MPIETFNLFLDVLRLQLNGYEVNIGTKPVMVMYANDFTLVSDYCRWSRLNEISFIRGHLKDLLVQHFNLIQYLCDHNVRFLVIHNYLNAKVRSPNLLLHETCTKIPPEIFREVYRYNTAIYPTKENLSGIENVKNLMDRLATYNIKITIFWVIGGLLSEQIFRNFLNYLSTLRV